MTIDKSITYVQWGMDEYGAYNYGDYTEFSCQFERDSDVLTTDFCPIMVVTDLAALQRYKDACEAYEQACRDLDVVLVRPAGIPELPPVPENHRWANYKDWRSDTDDKECSIKGACNHWHAHVCRCGGECTCHWKDSQQ